MKKTPGVPPEGKHNNIPCDLTKDLDAIHVEIVGKHFPDGRKQTADNSKYFFAYFLIIQY